MNEEEMHESSLPSSPNPSDYDSDYEPEGSPGFESMQKFPAGKKRQKSKGKIPIKCYC